MKSRIWSYTLFFAVSAFGMATCPAIAKTGDKPVAWGLMSSAKHCVIFKESRKISGGFFVVVATVKSVGKLTVIESGDYAFEPSTYVEDQPTMDALETRAMHERLRYVKIPDNYSPELLQAARDMCAARDLLDDRPGSAPKGDASSGESSSEQSQ